MTTEQLETQDMTVLNDPREASYNAMMTTYIYFPTNNIDSDSYGSPYLSFNFKYSEKEIDLLSSKMEQIFSSSIDSIVEVMKQVSQKRFA